MWEEDEIVIKAAFGALLHIVPEPGTCEHLLEMGGRDLIDKAMSNHVEEPKIKGDGTKIMYALLGQGANVAIRDLKRVERAIQYKVPLAVAESIKVRLSKESGARSKWDRGAKQRSKSVDESD